MSAVGILGDGAKGEHFDYRQPEKPGVLEAAVLGGDRPDRKRSARFPQGIQDLDGFIPAADHMDGGQRCFTCFFFSSRMLPPGTGGSISAGRNTDLQAPMQRVAEDHCPDPVGGLNILRGDHLPGASRSQQLAPGQQQKTVKKLGGQVQIMDGGQHRNVFLPV